MRCQSCEDHGFHDYRFCSCCGRPLTEHDATGPPGVEHRSARCGRGTLGLPVAEVGAMALVPDAMSAGPVSTAPGRCECCGAPWAGAGTLCDGCGRVFGHVLDAVHAEGGHAVTLAPAANAAASTVERHADTGPQEADGNPRGEEAHPRAVDASPHDADDDTREAVEGPGDEDERQRAVDAGPVSGPPGPMDEDAEAAARASAWWNLPPAPPPAPEPPVPTTVSPANPPARANRDRNDFPTLAPAAFEPRAARPQAGPVASAALPTRAARGEVRRRWLPGPSRRPHRAAKVVAGCGGLVVLLLLGVPAVQPPWSAHVRAVRAGAEPPAAGSPAASGTVTGAVPPAQPLSAADAKASVPGSLPPAAIVVPMAAVQAPVGATSQQGLRRDTPVSRSAKANTKPKSTAARKPVKNEPVAEAPAPVVVPERFVPLPMQAPPAVTGVDARASIGPTYEPGQVDVRPRVESQVAASVPAHLRSRQLKEVVVLRVRVSASGRTSEVQVLRKSTVDTTLDSAAVAAVKQWRFSPARRRGEAVNCWLNVGVPFRPAGDDGTR